MVKNMGGGGGDAVKEICVGGCIRPGKVCGGCDVLRADLTGWCQGRKEHRVRTIYMKPHCCHRD